MSSYGITKKVNYNFKEAIDKTIDALKSQGFGILTDIDVTRTLKEKLDVKFNNYRILGACNPPRAHKALQIEEEVGLLLPCNVIVYQNDEGVFVSALNPKVAFSLVDNQKLEPIALEVEKIMKKVIEGL
ncbi:MAG: hypothetical protein COT81_05140 [Candidatus Buchananbacteria bacterium CG10_big_fil_rev_8_21_14_0_10_42_9]|uniref:DUF302 domain-containing protein n=1 Tax=Candidatus Buchananbacteria bacterium CG10_big_fil_rev_8_21_14_0_10_42_9 TaxID=1974526 RepID=A0A2H0W007_9BACT|nr:MAG: hypothetical protein COT81_05140 [Candidatus Buchananbacteria bacterium CG10_big_fil_rev_8_21_14_0_10_42_9]